MVMPADRVSITLLGIYEGLLNTRSKRPTRGSAVPAMAVVQVADVFETGASGYDRLKQCRIRHQRHVLPQLDRHGTS